MPIKTEANLLELMRADRLVLNKRLAEQSAVDLEAAAEHPRYGSSAARGDSRAVTHRQPLQTTFDRSGHRAPHESCSLRAILRGQSAVISFDHSNSFASTP
jgi:hypothetical protein